LEWFCRIDIRPKLRHNHTQCMHYKISYREERQYQNGTSKPNSESTLVHHHDMQAQST
jgi:hypothetical protein